jgi:hypothetical protein
MSVEALARSPHGAVGAVAVIAAVLLRGGYYLWRSRRRR